MPKPTMLIVGGGPKALALVAKKRALDDLGFATPDVTVVDELGVAAHWTGRHGYTDGLMPLGTPPEKDVGFPYRSNCWDGLDGAVNRQMLQVSWLAYLASGESPGGWTYDDWVDRGRPQPQHREWGNYLRWVGDQLELDFERGRVTEIGFAGRKWKVRIEAEGGWTELEADALVVTGPGPPLQVCERQPEDLRIVDGRTHWLNLRELSETGPINACVIGSGETAGAIAVNLLTVARGGTGIDIVSPVGVVYSRGESYEENRLFSDPSEWKTLSEAHREQFVGRTDRGVFSMHAKSILNDARNVRTLVGRVRAMEATGTRVLVEIEYEGQSRWESYDYVVCATGFDVMWFVDAMTQEARDELERVTALIEPPKDTFGERLKRSIREDLAVDRLQPYLHLPMLAALNEGPGFPNLSSLGLLSDRVLRPYVRSPERPESANGASQLPEREKTVRP